MAVGVDPAIQTRVDTFIAKAFECGSYSFDIEHDPEHGPHSSKFKIHGAGFSAKDMTFYETRIDVIGYLLNMLFPTDLETIAYNAKYDIMCVKNANLVDEYPKNLVDPMIAVNLLDDNRHYNQLSLKNVIMDYFGEERETFEQASAAGLDSDQFLQYACNDARDEWRLWQYVKPKLEEENLYKVFSKILMPVSKVFADMESVGIGWDFKGARMLLRGFQKIRNTLEKEIYGEIGELNLNSGDQLAQRLFYELGYSTSGVPMTASGKRFSVDVKVMDSLAKKYPVCKKISLYRTAAKMISTYVEPLTRRSLNDPVGRIHPTFWLVSTTGRTRSQNPNFQNIPAFLAKSRYFKGLDIRGNVVPKTGRKLIVADLSQIELRLVAHITQDPVFLSSYREWQCTKCDSTGSSNDLLVNCPECGCAENEAVIESDAAKREKGFWHGLDLHQITTDKVPALEGNRQNGKAANFALVYFATAKRMHYEHPSLSVNQWQDIINEYFDVYRGVRHWHLFMEKCLYAEGEYKDIFGRKRRLPEAIIRRNPKHALNMIINFSPQASACEMLQLSLINIRNYFKERECWLRSIWPTNMVHDEVVFEADEDKAEEYASVIRNFLETPVKLHVPVRANVTICSNWSEGK